jgi:RND family efflux transporter MFP subunit
MKALRIAMKFAVVLAVFIAGYGYGRWYAVPRAAQASMGNKRRILYYVDPMNPAHRSDKPGTAPDGMALQPVYADEASVAPTAKAEAATAAPNLPMGTVQISPQRQQLIGVKYGFPTLGAPVKSIRAVGKVAPDEQRIAHVHTRVDGWIDQVFVDFTGKVVDKDQPLLTLYSPDLLATQEEYLLGLKSQDLMKASTLPGALGQSESLVAASRRRLQLWDLTAEQIDEIARTGKPVTNITVYSPVSGYVMARNAFPKQRIMPDTELYTIIDLSRVWIMADVFESEAALIQINQPVTIDMSYGPPGRLKGRVDYIQPQVDPVTRTLKIRIDAENPRMALKPDMFVNVNFRIALPPRITVLRDAVLDAGLKKLVFVDRGNGYLEPREVETGEQLGDSIEILRGLKPHERIVISGTFLIDSESQLKSAASGMGGMPGMPGMTAPNKSQPAAPPKPSTEPGSQMQDMKDMPGMGKSNDQPRH